MEFNVKLALGPGNWFPTTLTVRQKGTEIYLDFGGKHSEPLFSDRFFSFTHVDFSSNDEPILTLSGPTVRSIRFENKTTISNVWIFLQKFIDFTATPGTEQQRFEMHRKPGERLKPTRSPAVSTSTNRRNTKLEKSLPVSAPLTASKPFEFLTQSSLRFLELPVCLAEPKDFQQFFVDGFLKTSALLPTLSCTDLGYAELFRMKLLPAKDQWEKAVSDYGKLRKQWKLLTVEQWRNASNLRQFVADLEFALDGCDALGETMKVLVFDTLMSYYMLRQKLKFVKSVFNTCVVFVKTYFIGSRGDNVFDRSGKEIPFVEAAATVFWSLERYLSLFFDYDNPAFVFPSTSFIHTCATNRLEGICPTVAAFLKSRHITSFDFLEEDIRALFISGRSLQDAQFIISCFLVEREPALLVILFVTSLFADIATRFADSPVPSDPDLFTEIIMSELSSVNLRLLVYNADALRTFIHSLTEPTED